jgi:protein-L-isoaspartate O-methyltransferase
MRPTTSTPVGRSQPGSGTTRRSSTSCPIERSSRSPASATRLSLRTLREGERVVDVGSGGGFDSFVAARHVGPDDFVVGVDMTDEMLTKSRATSELLGVSHVEFRYGLAEALPVEDGWATWRSPTA